jgi:uncharacterized protein
VIVDANVLLYAVDEASPFHERARTWLDDRLGGDVRIGLPWQSLAVFQRIATRSRVLTEPLAPGQAWAVVEAWLDAPSAWIPVETEGHREVLGGLINRYQVAGNLVTDARLAALAIEHGVPVASADTDFARFTEVQWINPLAS